MTTVHPAPKRSAMRGRVMPNKMGLPTYVQVNKVAANNMTGSYEALVVDDEGVQVLRLTPMPSAEKGLTLTQTGRLRLGAILDQFNNAQTLSDIPFPIVRKRLRGGEIVAFDLHLHSPDPELRRGGSRENARPMRLVGEGSRSQPISDTQMLRLFALVELIEGAFSEDDLQRRRGILEGLPTYDDLIGRFGSWERFREFLEFQVAVLKRKRLDENELKNQFYELSEGLV